MPTTTPDIAPGDTSSWNEGAEEVDETVDLGEMIDMTVVGDMDVCWYRARDIR